MENATPEIRKKSTDTIHKQVGRINDMIGEILDFTRGIAIRSGDGGFGLRSVRAAIARGSPSRNRPQRRAARMGRFAAGESCASIPNACAASSRILFTTPPTPCPTAAGSRCAAASAKTEVVTEIEDTGPGRRAGGRRQSVRLAFTTFGKAHGTGLGLSICKKIIEDHKGRIWATHQSGNGALFSFALPVPT